MSTPTRCHQCDTELATEDDWRHADDCMDESCGVGESRCWSEGSAARCVRPAVDWRARCLQAESALAILQTPLSPEALQAIAEESVE